MKAENELITLFIDHPEYVGIIWGIKNRDITTFLPYLVSNNSKGINNYEYKNSLNNWHSIL